MRRALVTVVAALIISAIVVGLLYRYALPGFSSARSEPPRIEVAVASWLLVHSVPDRDAHRVNPLPLTDPDVAAGATAFQQNCAVCHGYDGSGRTQIGGNVYPRAPALRELLPAVSDGQVFAFVRDGIRNTAMPAAAPSS